MADAVVSGISAKENAYVSNKKKDDKGNSGELDKDAFLQLLVTQMKYQDPMNPGDSTEYMSQLAQYSSLEATMNISSTLEKGNALNLVGQYVIMNTTDSAGNSKMVSGLVQYVTVKDGETLLSINDTYYPADELDSVVDYDYYLYLQKQQAEASKTEETNKPDEKTDDDSKDNTENDSSDEKTV